MRYICLCCTCEFGLKTTAAALAGNLLLQLPLPPVACRCRHASATVLVEGGRDWDDDDNGRSNGCEAAPRNEEKRPKTTRKKMESREGRRNDMWGPHGPHYFNFFCVVDLWTHGFYFFRDIIAT